MILIDEIGNTYSRSDQRILHTLLDWQQLSLSGLGSKANLTLD